MRQEIADIVYPVLNRGLRLKERLRRGERLNREAEQITLKGLLQSENVAMQKKAYGGDGITFLGIRYALVCWLDEIFIFDQHGEGEWGRDWADHLLEEGMYASRSAADRFWEQAEVAERSGEIDALEAFYLCVMLGFRGKHRDDVAALNRWCNSVEDQFNQYNQDWPGPPDLGLPPNVPPLTGRERLGRMMLVVGLFVAVLIFGGAFLLTWLQKGS